MRSHVSLFSGIGGFDLAAEWAGFTTVLFVEQDEYCQKVLRKHWSGVPIIEDVRNVIEIERPTVITGGFPCQDLSVAGCRAGLAGEQSGLWWEFHRILAAVRPTWTVIENVPGLLSSNGGRDMGTILWALGQLGYGYAYRVLDAQYFGVAQRRRRVFIVGHLGSAWCAAKVLLEPEGLCGHSPPRREKGQEVAGTLGGGSPHRGFGTGELDSHGAYIVANALTRRTYPSMRGDGADNLVVASALTASGGHHGHSSPRGDGADNLVAGFSAGQGAKARSLGYAEGQSPTLRAAPSGTNMVPSIHQGASVRRLTPLECERLQGFPDGWTGGCSDARRYKMLGNAVAVPVAYEILRSIVEIEA